MKQTFLRSRKIVVAIVCMTLFLSVSASLPQAQASTFVQNRYLRFDPFAEIHGALNWFGWSNATDTFGNSYGEYSWLTTNRTLRWGFRVFRFNYTDVDFNYAENQIGSGTTVIGQRIQSGEGYQSTAWTSTETNLTRLDSLEIRFYTSYLIVGSTWSGWSELSELTYFMGTRFLTEPLSMTKLESSTWNITVYTYKFWLATILTSRIYFGDSTYQSRIENIQLNDGVSTPEIVNTAKYILIGGLLFSPIMLVLALKYRKTKNHKNQEKL